MSARSQHSYRFNSTKMEEWKKGLHVPYTPTPGKLSRSHWKQIKNKGKSKMISTLQLMIVHQPLWSFITSQKLWFFKAFKWVHRLIENTSVSWKRMQVLIICYVSNKKNDVTSIRYIDIDKSMFWKEGLSHLSSSPHHQPSSYYSMNLYVRCFLFNEFWKKLKRRNFIFLISHNMIYDIFIYRSNFTNKLRMKEEKKKLKFNF